jgi:hypothetical protein
MLPTMAASLWGRGFFNTTVSSMGDTQLRGMTATQLCSLDQ